MSDLANLSASTVFGRVIKRWNTQADEFNQWSALGLDEKKVLLEQEECDAGDIRVFLKSGNIVRLKSFDGQNWLVSRLTGASAGKQMLCSAKALWPYPFDDDESLVEILDTVERS